MSSSPVVCVVTTGGPECYCKHVDRWNCALWELNAIFKHVRSCSFISALDDLNVNRCISALEELNELSLVPFMLKKQPDIVTTIR